MFDRAMLGNFRIAFKLPCGWPASQRTLSPFGYISAV
jgi:hypothetical protein